MSRCNAKISEDRGKTSKEGIASLTIKFQSYTLMQKFFSSKWVVLQIITVCWEESIVLLFSSHFSNSHSWEIFELSHQDSDHPYFWGFALHFKDYIILNHDRQEVTNHTREDIICNNTYPFFICSCHLIIQDVILHSWKGGYRPQGSQLPFPMAQHTEGASASRHNRHESPLEQGIIPGNNTDMETKQARGNTLCVPRVIILLIYCQLQYNDKNSDLSFMLYISLIRHRLWKESCFFYGTNYSWCTDF